MCRIGRGRVLPIAAVLGAAAVLALGATGLAQAPSDAFLQQQRALEEQVRDELDRELPLDQKVNLDAGGWYSYYLFLWDDGIESSRTYRQHDGRIWTSLSLDQGAHQFYARGKMQFHDFNSGDSFDGDDDDWLGPNLDRGYYQFDLRQAMKAYRNEQLKWNLKTKVGRDFAEFGTGFALSQPLDQVLLTAELADFEIQGLAAASIRSSDDIDTSRPDAGNSERNFWGVQVKYQGLEKHEPFFYTFWNEDQHREKPPDWVRNYDYDSWYIGLGSTGELWRNLRYGTEWVFEGGRSYDYRRSLFAPQSKSDIDAWAFDINLEYLSQLPMKPRIGAEYMFASGDPNRQLSPTNVVGGNTSGDDNSFSGFGYRDTGLSFGPRLSNVHVWRTGAAFLPFEKIRGLEKMELGTDWFLYAKNRSHGAVSDPTADQQSGYLGWEMDYFVNWRLTSDLSWTTRFGTFFPGDAFSDQTTRTFLLMGVTWSF